MPVRLKGTLLGVTALAMAITGPDCRAALPEPGDTTLLVLAAASLTDVLPLVADAWEATGGLPVRFSFDATSRLAPQTLQGGPADLFFSADEAWMDWVAERGGIRPETRTDLLRNDLVVVVPNHGGLQLSGPHDLAKPSVRHLALAGENVPAGRYAQAALESEGVWDQVSPKVVRAGTVRGALEWVALGETEAGVVYRTDAVADDRVAVAFGFPAGSHEPILYPAAVLTRSPYSAEARGFLEFCRSEAGISIFMDAGFQPAATVVAGTRVRAQPDVPDLAPLPDLGSAVRLSFWVALAATLVGFVPAVWFGWILARREFIGKTLVTTVALTPLVLPPVVTGFILLSILGTQSPVGAWLSRFGVPVPFTLLGATLAALTVGFPLYVISIRNAFQTVDPSYEAVAWTLGRRPWPTFLRVTFPLALPGIAAGAVLAFARALGEFGATVVLAGNVEGRTRTIALAVYTLLESPRGRGAIWLLVVSSVILSLLALLGFEALSRHQRRQMGLDHDG